MLLALCACRLNFDDAHARDAVGDGSSDATALIDASGEPAVFEIGTFTKRTGVGTQVVSHSLGKTPRAMIAWTSGHPTQGFSTSTSFALGFTDQTLTSRSVAIFSQDGNPRAS